ncbi:MAG: hypothetical protein IJE73_04580 [Muribaculaceae bacterium]|nr:hypothetical protein [Muribaculaceae bacterium]
MKKILLFTLLVLVGVSCYAQWSIGLRDNNYVNVAYELNKKWEFKLEHSVFAEKIPYQYIRVNAGYKQQVSKFEFLGFVYGGTIYNGDFYNVGAKIGAEYSPINRLKIKAAINPHYDSGYDYSTCYQGGVWFNAYKALSIVASVSNIPEYRKAEDRVYLGLSFDVGPLWVSPRVSIPIEDSSVKSMRLLTSVKYEF